MSVISHILIVDVIASTGVTLKRRNDKKLVGPHPQHDSNSGECLVVFEDKSTWWCSSCEQKGDAADWLADVGKVGDKVIENRKQAVEYLIETYGLSPLEWREPIRFGEHYGPDFPLDTLPEITREYVSEVSDAIQVPTGMAGGLMLGVGAAASAGRVSVQAKEDWEEPTNLYVAIVAETGERKSPIFREVTAPLESFQQQLVEESIPVVAEAQMERDILDAQLTAVKKSASKSNLSDDERQELTSEAVSLAQTLAAIEVPATPRIVCDDVTSEALVTLMAQNGGTIAQFSTEGGVFSMLAGRYRNGELTTEVHLKGYSGDPIYVDRKNRNSEYIKKPLLTVGVTVQPFVIQGLSQKPGFRAQGIIGRFLISINSSKVGYRELNAPPISEDVRRASHTVIESIASLPKETEETPHLVELSPGAKVLFDEYRDDIETKLRPGGELREIQDWVLKLPGAVVRIAGILHLFENHQLVTPWDTPITDDTMTSAIRLGRYFTEHALVAYGIMGLDGRNAAARDTWETIRHNWIDSFTLRDLHQHVRRRFRDVNELAETLQILEDMQYIRRLVTPSATGRGNSPSPTYEINPLALAEDPDPTPDPNSVYSVYNVYGSGKENSRNSDTDDNIKEESAPSDNIQKSHDVTVGALALEDRNSESPLSKNPAPIVPDTENSTPQERTRCTHCTHKSTGGCVHDLPVHYVTDIETVRSLVAELQTEPVLSLDIETTGLDPILDKIRTVQVSTTKATWVIDMYIVPVSELRPLLEGGPVKVIQNAKFDAGFLYSAQGGCMPEPMYDTMLADQVIHHRKYGRSLKDLAEDYLGLELDKGQQASDWSSEELTSEQIRYAALDAAVLIPLHRALAERVESLRLTQTVELENRTVPSLVWMERNGVGFDHDKWNVLVEDARRKLVAVEEELNTLVTDELGEDDMMGHKPYVVNWSSSAQVLKTLRSLGIEVDDTRYETLERHQSKHSVVPLILKHREAAKKLSTYGDKWSKHVHPATERIHADWKQIGAATGRMSCSKPNLQNLPRDKAYRACFTPAPGRVLIKADYSQIELRIAAEMANDSRMKQAFADGIDLHTLTATMVTGKINVADVTPDERQLAKAVNFGLIYGMGAERLSGYARSSYGVELDLNTAESVRNRYFSAYPDIRKWHRIQGKQKETHTVIGRLRTFDGAGYFTERLNSPVQGSGADGLKFALARLWETRGDIDAYPVLTVHDEIVVEADAEIAEEAKVWLEQCMVEGMRSILKEVPVVVESEIKSQW